MALTRRLWNSCDSIIAQEIVSFARECGISPELELPTGIIGRKRISPNGDGVVILSSFAEQEIECVLPISGKCLYGHGTTLDKNTHVTLSPGQTEVIITQD
ncbi:MAG: hypothetical protein LBM70_08985 [Victivallales bacterium]|nr:hypothetical protein [Victivallales bacterium]